MKSRTLGGFLFFLSHKALLGGTVVLSFTGDPVGGSKPLTTLVGVPLTTQSEVLIGSFPGILDEGILDMASQDGLAGLEARFVQFGQAGRIGQGVRGDPGRFEIAVRDEETMPAWAGEYLTVIIKSGDGSEYLVARFTDSVFEADTETGLEQLLVRDFSDANIIVGNRTQGAAITTGPSPSVGSFNTWLAGFPSISDPLMKLPGADPDSDGIPNFLEYATGGNPGSGGGAPPFWIQRDSDGVLRVFFRRVVGLGINYDIQQSNDLGSLWRRAAQPIKVDAENTSLMKMEVPLPLGPSEFFRLLVEP